MDHPVSSGICALVHYKLWPESTVHKRPIGAAVAGVRAELAEARDLGPQVGNVGVTAAVGFTIIAQRYGGV